MIRGTLTQEGKVVCEISVPHLFAEARQLWLRPIPSSCCAGSFHFLFVCVVGCGCSGNLSLVAFPGLPVGRHVFHMD